VESDWIDVTSYKVTIDNTTDNTFIDTTLYLYNIKSSDVEILFQRNLSDILQSTGSYYSGMIFSVEDDPITFNHSENNTNSYIQV